MADSSLLHAEDSKLLWGWEDVLKNSATSFMTPRDTTVMQTSLALNGHRKGSR